MCYFHFVQAKEPSSILQILMSPYSSPALTHLDSKQWPLLPGEDCFPPMTQDPLYPYEPVQYRIECYPELSNECLVESIVCKNEWMPRFNYLYVRIWKVSIAIIIHMYKLLKFILGHSFSPCFFPILAIRNSFLETCNMPVPRIFPCCLWRGRRNPSENQLFHLKIDFKFYSNH